MLTASALPANPCFTASAAEKTKIMPLGDSITFGMADDGGYRKYLWQKLKVSVFSRGQLKMLVLMVLLLAANMGWDWLFGAVQQGSIVSVVARATLKTAVLGALAAGGVLLWKVSPTVNEMVARVKTRGPKL